MKGGKKHVKIYTSYWAQVRNFPQNLVGLNTTVWPPKYRPLGQDNRGVWVIDCPILKPGKECENLCRGQCAPRHPQTCSFLKTYYEQLTNINFDNFMQKISLLHEKFYKGEMLNVDFALIVFEAPNNPCSERWPLQRWLSNNGVMIEEWHK